MALSTRARTRPVGVKLGVDLNHPGPMGQRLIISDNRDDLGNPLILEGEAIDVAARHSLAIGKLMVDQVWAGGTDPTGGGL